MRSDEGVSHKLAYQPVMEGPGPSASTSCTRSPKASGFMDLTLGTIEFWEALLSAGSRAFFADNWSDHRLLQLCLSKKILLFKNNEEPRRTCHFNIKNRKQREIFITTLKEMYKVSGTMDSIQSCLDSFSGECTLRRDKAIKLMKKIEERFNATAPHPVSKFCF